MSEKKENEKNISPMPLNFSAKNKNIKKG